MALVKNRTTNLSGESKINGTTVVSMSATLSTAGDSDYVNQQVHAPELYVANKREIRKDIAEFQDYVYEQQDAIAAEVAEDEAAKTEETKVAGTDGAK